MGKTFKGDNHMKNVRPKHNKIHIQLIGQGVVETLFFRSEQINDESQKVIFVQFDIVV